jgi:fatty-acyl-CoA synthase
VVAATSFKTLDYRAMLKEIAPATALEYVILMSAPHAPDDSASGYLTVEEVSSLGNNDGAKEKLEKVAKRVQFDDAVNIQFTSGTTGLPKGAVLSHHNIVNNAYFLGNRIGYGEKQHKICLPVPLYHCFGSVAGTACSVIHGG